MSTFLRRRRAPGPTIAVPAVTALVLLAACAGDGGPAAAEPSGTPAVPTPAPTPPAPTSSAPTSRPPPASTAPPESACSAAGLWVSPQADLPEAVADRRAAIVAAATACDYAALATLTSDSGFTYSFGGGDDPAGYWRELEATGRDHPLRTLVRILGIDYGTIRPVDPERAEAGGERIWVWPSAFAFDDWESVPDADRDALRAVVDEAAFDDFALFGGYVGYRAGITESGEWIFFVAGD